MDSQKYDLSRFNQITLNRLNQVQLLNRKDTKFIFNKSNLPKLLEWLKPEYLLLNISKSHIFRYDNIYYDTDDFLFYKQHHNEKRNRYKVRFRKYSTTNDCYFEIKTKNNKNRTVKKRHKVISKLDSLGVLEKQLVSDITNLVPHQLTPKLHVNFSRITLADKNLTERLTIDTDLSVKNGVSSKIFEPLVISEIKQNKYNPRSHFIRILRDMKIPEMRFSKYCMGMLHVNENLKYNRFKPKLLQINKILDEN